MANAIWAKVAANGEISNSEEIFNSQLAQTIAYLTNSNFTSSQPIEPHLYNAFLEDKK